MRTTSTDTNSTWIICYTVIVMTAIFVVGGLIALAIFYRESGFQVELDKEGKVVLQFEGNKTTLAEMLEKALTETSSPEMRHAEIVLESLGYYQMSNRRLIYALRELRQGDDTHGFTSALRELLYDLKGPFSRPHTFSGARDARLLEAFDDLEPKSTDPEAVSPLLSKLWRMSLNHQGIFRPRHVNAVIEAAPGIKRNRASTCIGSILGGKEVMIQGRGGMKSAMVDADYACNARSPRELLAGKPERLRLAPDVVAELQGFGYDDGLGSEPRVTLFIFPKYFRNLDDTLHQQASLQ